MRKFQASITAAGIAVMQGSKADLVLSQPYTMDFSDSAVMEAMGKELNAMQEVRSVTGMLQGLS